MYTLYRARYSRSLMVEMVLAEGDIPYRTVELDMRAGDHRKPEFLAVNPAGWIPALVTPDGEALYETPAINLWLAERHGLTQLVPAIDDARRGAFLSALFNVTGEVEPAMKRIFYPGRYAPAPEQIHEARALAWDALAERIAPIERRLADSGPFFLGDRFSLADLTLAYWMPYVAREGVLGDYPAVAGALEQTRARPALAPGFAQLDGWLAR